MKPIEPGCLCLVINSLQGVNIGKHVTAVERDIWWNGKAVWSVDGASSGFMAFEEWLLRIDGGEDESITETQEEEATT